MRRIDQEAPTPLTGASSGRRYDLENAEKMRSLAAWYREFAEKAANPWIWEARLLHAQELEREAERLTKSTNRASGR
jgi:hypothetical protein